MVGEGDQWSVIRFIETPVDSTVTDTVRFVLLGDSAIKLVSTSPLGYRYLINVSVTYNAPEGDTSIAHLVIWDADHIDTVEIVGISTGDGIPDTRVVLPSFEAVQPNSITCGTVTVYNDEDYDVTFNGVGFYPMTPWTAYGLTVPSTIGAHDSLMFEICLTSDSAVQRIDSIGLYFFGGGRYWTVARGIPVMVGACFSVSNQYLNFGSMLVGTDSTITFSITNSLNESITVDISNEQGGEQNTYTFTGFPKTIAANSSANIDLKVDVNTYGYAVRGFTLTRTDAQCGSIYMSAAVYGDAEPCYTVLPDSVQLPPMLLGDDTTITFAFIGNGTDTIVINSYENQIDSSATYVWSGSWPITIPPGDTVYMDLTIQTTDLGNLREYWNLFATDSLATCGSGHIAILGSVYGNVSLPQADIFDEKQSLDVASNVASLLVQFNLLNNSGKKATITSLNLKDSTHFTFRKIPLLPATIEAGNTKLVNLIFTALTAGIYSDTLVVTLSDNSRHEVILNGTQQSTAAVGIDGNVNVDLRAWPNPATNAFTLTMDNAQRAAVSIMDMLGRTIHEHEVNFPVVYQASELGLSTGSYIVRVSGVDIKGAPFVHSIMISIK